MVKLDQSWLSLLYSVSRAGLSYDGEGIIVTKTIWFVKFQIFYFTLYRNILSSPHLTQDNRTKD